MRCSMLLQAYNTVAWLRDSLTPMLVDDMGVYFLARYMTTCLASEISRLRDLLYNRSLLML